jgi:2-dehydro-3-deoxyphosphogluconate aldolase/(4S)-4-hydroxy-2-oxoglutarate aldolase
MTADMSDCKFQRLGRIVESGLVAVIRAESCEQATRIAGACADGGVAALEVTFTVPRAAAVIEDLVRSFKTEEILIGAGTVLDPETARVAISSGAEFVVSPCLNLETARLAKRYQIPYMPGAGSVREIVEAMECGAFIVKVFPGEVLGPAFVKAVRGPLPQAQLMPAGGVSLENAKAWLDAGSVALGVGGTLTAGAKTGDYASITRVARRFIEIIQEARGRRRSELSHSNG